MIYAHIFVEIFKILKNLAEYKLRCVPDRID